jgi:hypothetical protein
MDVGNGFLPRYAASHRVPVMSLLANKFPTTVRCAAFFCALVLPAAQVNAGVWQSRFKDRLADWPHLDYVWGGQNQTYITDANVDGAVLRIALHKGAIDPASMRQRNLPLSGTGFKSRVIPDGAEAAILTYKVRFPDDFDFVRGGKLPGLFGGVGNSGGHIPNGSDGFSFRLMWMREGQARVYAYLPSSVQYGTGIFENRFRFQRGRWHTVMEVVRLNTPGKADGMVSLQIDGIPVGRQNNLLIRKDAQLRINGVFVDVFFGGNEDTWAPPRDSYVDLAEFEVHWQ